MLYRTEKLKVDELRRVQDAFDALDADGSGFLDKADVEAARRRARGEV